MINIQTIFDKYAVHKGQKELQLLVELTGHKTKKQKPKQKLNISFVIDISGSMDGVVKNKYHSSNIQDLINKKLNPQPKTPQNPWNPWKPDPNAPFLGVQQGNVYHNNYQNNIVGNNIVNNHFPQYEREQYIRSISKLDQAKEATKKAISQMKDGDFASIVVFDDKATTLATTVETTTVNKEQLFNIIDGIKTRGSTNLHDGWVYGATEVAKKMSQKFINRVIVLTDGQTNAGITDPHVIANSVAALYEKSISTTTFGIGSGFNEDLLQKMANAGGGNFYYIEDDSQIQQMFADEFNGLTNICATEVRLSFEGLDKNSIESNLNNYEQKENEYLIPNIQLVGKISALFKVNTQIEGKGKDKNFKLGTVVISYKDEEGQNQKVSIELNAPIVSQKEWDKMDFNEEIKVQETLMVIANNKIAATRAIDLGNYDQAKDLLAGSMAYAASSGLADARIQTESMTLNATFNKNASAEDLRKDLSYQSYKTRYSKE